MASLHPLLHAATECSKATHEALVAFGKELKATPPPFMGTVAINLWSPYLPFGRQTELLFPKSHDGRSVADDHGGIENLLRVHHRYMTLLGRNLSANHLLVEVQKQQISEIEVPKQEISEIIVDATAHQLDGPSIENRGEPLGPSTIHLRIPLLSPQKDDCFQKLVPPERFATWLEWIVQPNYEQRYQGLLRDELHDCRIKARGELPEAFARHLSTWLRRNWVAPHIGLADFDDRWLARLQLTALASKIWGNVWISRSLSLGQNLHERLNLLASCTVTAIAADQAATVSGQFRSDVSAYADRCSRRLGELIQEMCRTATLEIIALEHKPWEAELFSVAKHFSNDLGGSLIAADHEGESICLRGVLTPGLDALAISPAQVKILHEIDASEFELLGSVETNWKEWWHLWKAYFNSNDLFLAGDQIALHFELQLADNGRGIFPVPRHVVQIAGSFIDFFQTDGPVPTGLLQIGFQTDKKMALHMRVRTGANHRSVESRVQTKGNSFKWEETPTVEPDWGCLREALCVVLDLIKNTLKDDDFFVSAASALAGLEDGQITQLADGIAEVRRKRRGCLVFIGPVYRKQGENTYWFVDSRELEKRLEITRLGISFGIVSQIPETFSDEFRKRFADAAAMDGETIVFAARPCNMPAEFEIDRPAGSITPRRFVQLPHGTPSLIHMTKPQISEAYAAAWDQAAGAMKQDYLEKANNPGVDCKAPSMLKRTDLLSLGTRHRKAAMTTMAMNSVLAITCSASGKLKVWINGVPIVELAPQSDSLLPDHSRPNRVRDQ